MAKHNYSQYSSKKKHTASEPVPVVRETTPKIKMETEPVVLMGPIEVLPETVTGIVANCAKLNIRSEPDITSDIVCVLSVTSEIEINVNESNNEWFKICTATGVEGYCMRKFVEAQL